MNWNAGIEKLGFTPIQLCFLRVFSILRKRTRKDSSSGIGRQLPPHPTVHDLLHRKEQDAQLVRQQLEALRIVAPLLDDEQSSSMARLVRVEKSDSF